MRHEQSQMGAQILSHLIENEPLSELQNKPKSPRPGPPPAPIAEAEGKVVKIISALLLSLAKCIHL